MEQEQKSEPKIQLLFNEVYKESFQSGINRLTLTGDEEDTTAFGSSIIIHLTSKRIIFQTSPKSQFFLKYHNCVSMGLKSNGLLLMASDVILNEKLDLNPHLLDDESEKSKDIIFEKIQNLEGDTELLGEYTIDIDCIDIREKLYRSLSILSGDCPDPEEYINLIGSNAQNKAQGEGAGCFADQEIDFEELEADGIEIPDDIFEFFKAQQNQNELQSGDLSKREFEEDYVEDDQDEAKVEKMVRE